jgi:hypothetical protein
MDIEKLSVDLSSDDPALGLRASLALHRLAERVEANHVALAREKGWSWQQIGDALGVTRQSVHTKYNKTRRAEETDVQRGHEEGSRPPPAAEKVLEQTVKPNRRRGQVAAQQVLAQILALQPPDPAAVLLGALGVNAAEVRLRLDAVTPHS